MKKKIYEGVGIDYSSQISRMFPGESLGISSKYCKTLTFQVTEDCNLNCSYCYQIHKTKNRMSLDTAKKVIDCLFDNDLIEKYYPKDNYTGIVLDFIGGEPLLEVDLIDSIMNYFIQKAYEHKSILATRYRISISTNGVLYNTPKVQEFIKKWEPKLSLSVSLDGCKELHDSCRVFPTGEGSYTLAEDAAKKLLKINPNMSTKMTIAPENIEFIEQAITNLIDLGYKSINCNCIFEANWTYDQAAVLYSKWKKVADYLLSNDNLYIPRISYYESSIGQPLNESDNGNWCGGTGLMLAVDYKGEFFPCLRYMQSSLGNQAEPYVIGDLNHGIDRTKESHEKLNCLSCITRRSQSTDECFNCSIAKGCAWCSAYNYQVTGTPNKRVTNICNAHKSRVLSNVYFWNKYYRINNIPQRFKLNINEEEALKIVTKDELKMLKNLSED